MQSGMPGQIPEQTIILREKDGTPRITLIIQMWNIKKDGQWLTYATTGCFGPIGMTDDDARWMAEQFRECFNQMERVVK